MIDALTIEGARKSFGGTLALDGAFVTLQKGEWLALLGPNGAGKTTLVRAVAGRVKLDQGDITLLGRSLTDGSGSADDARAKLGTVPQEIAVYPMLTAAENLRAFAALSGVALNDRADRVRWALEWIGLADRANEPVKRFSGGMKRRLNIACGVLHRPEVILLDEPTVGVDPQSRQRIWEMLNELRAQGASILLTTHQLDEAQQICDRIAIIDHGKAIADGSFDDLLRQTIGSLRRVIVHLHEEPSNTLIDRGFDIEPNHAVARSVADVARELPAMLQVIESTGGTVRDLQIDAPTLQAVFIHLTGRELRE